MHRCLRLTEIIEIIFYSVFNDDFEYVYMRSPNHFPDLLPSPSKQDRRSVLHLALTCRTFRDPALNVLYSYLREFYRPLVKCLPDQLVRQVISHRPFPAEQFRQFVLAAARVRNGWNSCFESNLVNVIIVASSLNLKDAPLFPKLRSLTWSWWEPDFSSAPALRLLLPTIENLSLAIPDDPFRDAILPDLHITAPRLKALELDGITTEDDLLGVESSLLKFPEGLTRFSMIFCKISNSLLDIIASWPRLRWLNLWLGLKSISTVPFQGPQRFQALNHLHIECEDLNHFTSFLRAFRMLRTDSDVCSFGCSNLKTIQVLTRRCHPGNIWSEHLSILTHMKLENIILCEDYHSKQQSCYLSPSINLRPLLARPIALTDLKTLVICPVHIMSVTVTDADILTLARTCPYLNVLSLSARNTPVSLYAFRILVERCHELCEVTLCVDAGLDALGAIPPNNNIDQVGLRANTRLVTLEVGESPIAPVGPLHPPTAPDLMMSNPRFLHAMAPRLMDVNTNRRSSAVQNVRWKAVSKALREMCKVDSG